MKPILLAALAAGFLAAPTMLATGPAQAGWNNVTYAGSMLLQFQAMEGEGHRQLYAGLCAARRTRSALECRPRTDHVLEHQHSGR